MPLRWNIARKKQMVSLHSEGIVRLEDMAAYLQALDSNHAFACRKLFDARLGFTEWNESEALSYAGMVSGYASRSRFGPCAVVATDESVTAHRPLITQLILTKRPFGIFRYMGDAVHWLQLQ
jgi:hypothetical protein